MFQLTWQDARTWNRHVGELRLPAPPPDPDMTHAALVCWEEHCLECSMPQCYATCSLYVARPDRKCARFEYGIYPNPEVQGLFNFGADIRFRRWAKLETAVPGRLAMPSVKSIRRQSAWLDRFETAISAFAGLIQKWSPKRKLNGAYTLFRRKLIERQSAWFSRSSRVPDAFFLKCYSPEPTAFKIQIELVTQVPVFRTSVLINPGWNQHYIDAQELIRMADGQPGRLRLSIENDQVVRVIFTWLHFVCFSDPSAALPSGGVSPAAAAIPAASVPAEKVKCVAWDLDNTLWHGVIGDAGLHGVTPNREMVELIHRLDERGVLQTIVSKNHYETAWPKIEQLGLADYFLFPAIHWGPKSHSLQQIAGQLNINVDAFAVIDDSAFERHEISTALPQVRVFDPADGPSIISGAEFDLLISDESRGRRLKYLAEAQRQRIHQTFRGDYDLFLKSCNMILQIRHPGASDQTRCVELLQRSNQFNLSGRRYTTEEFHALLSSAEHDCYCFEVADDFGGYGIVGFAAFQINDDVPVLVDFVLSCRVAQKMVELTFIRWYAARQQQHGRQQLQARLRVTSRNAPLRDVLAQLGFECIVSEQDRQLLELRFEGVVEPPDVITIDDHQVNVDQESQVAVCRQSNSLVRGAA